ncbi:MAG: hypothetical protein WBE76_08150 [Terracidiphilus sp.]
MFKFLLIASLFLMVSSVFSAQPLTPTNWKERVAESMPLLGHRNWILVVDSAYPLQTSPGVETVETNANQLEVVQYVLGAIERSIQVRPDIYMDAELPFVPDEDAPGASNYHREIGDLLHNYNVQSRPHEKIISDIDEAGKEFHILVLKTNLTIPYTSVFIRLNCKYWSDDAEKRLRAKMSAAAGASGGGPGKQ